MVALPIRFFFSARVNKFLKRANSLSRSAFNRAQVGYRQQLIQLARPLKQPKQLRARQGGWPYRIIGLTRDLADSIRGSSRSHNDTSGLRSPAARLDQAAAAQDAVHR
jgi:hypothetical protein